MINTVSAREADRQAIAAAVAAFVEENGPIETTAIIVGEDKKIPYRISCQDAKKPKPRSLNPGSGSGSQSKIRRAANLERVRPYLDSGLRYTEIGKILGLTAQTVSSLVKELKGVE